jgi:hypothetical protein
VAEQQGRHLCGCGCGQPIPIRPWHFNLGIPAYLAGHNTRVLYLRPDIQIHHIDGVKDHNKVSNLQPMTAAEHTRWHQQHRHPHK